MARRKNVQQEKEPTRKQAAISRRDRTGQRIILIVFAGLVPALILGILAYGLFQSGVLAPNRPVATINGEVITADSFRKRVRLTHFLQTQGPTQQQQAVDTELLGENVLDTMINDILLLQDSERRGLTVSEAEIEDEIRRSFGFSPLASDAYDPTPTSTPDVTLTPTSTFVLSPTPSPTLEATAAVEGLALTATPPTLDENSESDPEEEDAGPTPTMSPQTPSDDEEELFESIYEENFALWSEASGMSEAEIRELFANQALFNKLLDEVVEAVSTTTEQALFGAIQVLTEAEAAAVLGRLEAGEPFPELAAEVSIDPTTALRGGEFGWASQEQLASFSPELAEFVFTQPLGEPGGPVLTAQTYLVVVVYEREDNAPLAPAALATRRQQEFQAFQTNLRVEATENIEIDDNWPRFLPDLG